MPCYSTPGVHRMVSPQCLGVCRPHHIVTTSLRISQHVTHADRCTSKLLKYICDQIREMRFSGRETIELLNFPMTVFKSIDVHHYYIIDLLQQFLQRTVDNFLRVRQRKSWTKVSLENKTTKLVSCKVRSG